MGGIDSIDKGRKISVAYTKKAMFKKWYHMGVLDVFGQVAWNMAAADNTARLHHFALPNWKLQ